MEAMACGLPVVVCEGASMPDLESSGAGLVVRPDVAALAEAMTALAGDAARRSQLGTRGRALVERDHSWSGIAARIDEVYRRVASAASAR
jgi:glycosyltransferase involved in cell wall biosynthesis